MFKPINSVIFLGVLFGVLYIQECKAEMQCQGKNLNLNETQIADVKRCLGYSGSTSIWKLPAGEFPCFGVCLFKVRGFFSDDGQEIVLDKLVAHLNRVVAETERKALEEGVTKCISEKECISESESNEIFQDDCRLGRCEQFKNMCKNLGTNDDKGCMKFMEFGQCIHDLYMDVCI